jgi:hypothetical protein
MVICLNRLCFVPDDRSSPILGGQIDRWFLAFKIG